MSGDAAAAGQPVLLGEDASRRDWSPWVAIALGATVFAALSLTAAITSRGFLEADACTHYLYARYALSQPHYLVDVWGRPFCTAVYAVPAALAGRLGVRVMSLLLGLAIAAITMRIARGQGYRWPALAFIFTLAQPLLFLHSFSELTELPYAFLLALTFWAYQKERWLLMALLAGLGPTSRPEGFGFLGLAALALVAHRRWWYLPVLVLPLVVWNHAGWVLFGRDGPWWWWLPDHWPYAAESLYDRGKLWHFLVRLPAVTSPLVFPAMVLGIGLSVRAVARFALARASADYRWQVRIDVVPRPWDHRRWCQLMIGVIPVLILVGHSLLYWAGKMASNGELRYMLVVAPFWALLAAKGWEWAWERFNWRRPLLWAGLAALVPVLTHGIYRVLPLAASPDWDQAEHVARWYQSSGMEERYPRLLSAHPGMFYFLELSPTAGGRVKEWKKQSVAELPAGTILFWDRVYGVYNSDAQRSVSLEEILKAGWRPLESPDGLWPTPAEAAKGPQNRLTVFVSPDGPTTGTAPRGGEE